MALYTILDKRVRYVLELSLTVDQAKIQRFFLSPMGSEGNTPFRCWMTSYNI